MQRRTAFTTVLKGNGILLDNNKNISKRTLNALNVCRAKGILIGVSTSRRICGDGCEITIDTLTNHYWNYKVDPKKQDKSWGDSIYTDFKKMYHFH